jgi:sarcosine oxidase subunit beta
VHYTSVDILIIGGGILGSSIAYHAARQGRSVLVVERGLVAGEPSASWASAGGIRRQGQDPAEAALASESVRRWPTLAEELGADLHYRQGGYLVLAESDAEAELLQASVGRQHAMGFADVALLDRQEVFSLVPGLGRQVVAGSYSPADGQADAARTTRAFAGAAQRHGARYWTGVEHLTLQQSAGHITGAQTSRSSVRAEQTVLAVGAWTGGLASAIGIQLPLRVRALQMLLSTPAAPGLLQPVIGAASRALSLKQLQDGAFLLGGGWLADPAGDLRSYTLREASLQGSWATACELFPAICGHQLARSWGGLQAQIFDDLPLLGSFSGLEGLTLAVGSWRGFGLAPAIGRAIADQLAGLPTPELGQLSPDRIATFDPADVAAFLAAPATGDTLE